MDKIFLQFNHSPDDFYGQHVVTPPTNNTYYIGPGTHPHYEVFYLIEGKLDYLIESEIYTVHPGEMIFVASTEIHTLKIDGSKPFNRAVFLFNFTALKALLGNSLTISDVEYFKGENFLHVIPRDIVKKHSLDKLLFSILQSESLGKYSYLHAVSKTLEFIIELDKIFMEQKTSLVKTPTIIDPYIKQVVNYINEHITEPLSLDTIANNLFTSKSTLCHKFSNYMNLSLNRYITIKKVNYARKLIYDGMGAIEASLAVGYENYTTFYFNYKKIFNAYPSIEKELK